jgi:hypothetical protein
MGDTPIRAGRVSKRRSANGDLRDRPHAHSTLTGIRTAIAGTNPAYLR